MIHTDLSRRSFLSLSAAAFAPAADGWVPLFDGKSLAGWRPNENQTTWKVVDGCLSSGGPRCHLFYAGPVAGASFKNFELEAEVMTRPGANSGIFFHTAYQPGGWLAQGFEVQVCNSHVGAGSYRENKKTGSLYGVRNVYKALVKDDAWFKLHIAVRANNVQIRLNGVLVVDFVEADPPVLAADGRGRQLSQGTFALQGHDPGSTALFRNLRVRPLPADLPKQPAPQVDGVYRKILQLSAANVPVVDYHGHLKLGLTMDELLRRSRASGVFYGVAVNCGKNFPVQDDASARQFLAGNRGVPAYLAMQAEGREWVGMFSPETVAQFDYVFTDSMTWSDDRGKRMRLWIKEEVGEITDAQEFMDLLVKRATGIFEREPVDIYVNPTFLPAQLAARYDELWTPARIGKMVTALKKNEIAIEINDRYRIPSLTFLQAAQQAGCKFTFGTNNTGPADLRRCDYGLEMTEALKLRWQDFFVPRAQADKPVLRRGLPRPV